MMRIKLLLLIISACCLCACPKQNPESDTIASKVPEARAPEDSGETLQHGKKLYVTLTGHQNAFESPVLIAAHFCKFLAPAADEVIPGSSVETPEAALQSAAFHKSDYAVLLNVRYWDKFAFTGYAIKADMDITVIDVRTGKTLRHNSIIAKCPMGTFGREASVKECLRPKANAWASRAFDIGIGTPASPNVMPPPPSTPSMR